MGMRSQGFHSQRNGNFVTTAQVRLGRCSYSRYCQCLPWVSGSLLTQGVTSPPFGACEDSWAVLEGSAGNPWSAKGHRSRTSGTGALPPLRCGAEVAGSPSPTLSVGVPPPSPPLRPQTPVPLGFWFSSGKLGSKIRASLTSVFKTWPAKLEAQASTIW